MKILFKIKICFICVILYIFALSFAFSHCLYKLNVISIIEIQNILNINYYFFLF